MGVVDHAKAEFLALGYEPIEDLEKDDPNRWIQEGTLELLEVFAKQGHSGGSAPFAISYFKKLASYEPLCPVTGADEEWNEVSRDDMFQNKRCSALFKDGSDGKPYYIEAIVWESGKDRTYIGSAIDSEGNNVLSRQYVKLPFTPKTFYVDVIEKEIGKEDYEHYIKDESQLEEVFEYYIKGK